MLYATRVLMYILRSLNLRVENNGRDVSHAAAKHITFPINLCSCLSPPGAPIYIREDMLRMWCYLKACLTHILISLPPQSHA